jgi:hypothetical protein
VGRHNQAIDEKNLPPGYWIDDQPDPLHTKEDVEELRIVVEQKEAKLRTKAIEPADRN